MHPALKHSGHEEYGWYRADTRGNRADVPEEFTPPEEHLAVVPKEPGEADQTGGFSDPLLVVVSLLTPCTDYRDVRRNLTDGESHRPDALPPAKG